LIIDPYSIDAGMLRGEESRADSVEEYKKSRVMHDRVIRHETRIEKLYYFEEIDTTLLFERQNHAYRVLDGKEMTQITQVHGHTGQLVSAEYMPQLGLLATTATDRTIRFWDPKPDVSDGKIYRQQSHMINTDYTQVILLHSSDPLAFDQ
jgi:WD40 repeat protein